MRARSIITIAILALAAGPVGAQDLEGALARMRDKTGDDYVAARKDALAVKDVKTTLHAKLVTASWTDENFSDLAVASIALAHAEHPELASRLDKIEGITPEHYTKRRHPVPECGRELQLLGKDGAGFLLEVAVKTFDDRAKTLSAQESAALREGLVIALAATRHPSAFFVCKKVARGASEPEGARLQAIQGLGTIGTAPALAEITAIHDDATQPASLRLATLRGAARVPTSDALSLLSKAAGSSDEAEKRQAIVALGTFGSSWAWKARGASAAEQGDALRSKAATQLVDALGAATTDSLRQAAIEAISVVAHDAARAPLEKLAKDETRPAATRTAAKQALDRLNTAIQRDAH
jgi:hypothetical protein